MSDIVINATFEESSPITASLSDSETLKVSLGEVYGTGGVTDYNKLSNRPSIDGEVLTGNRNLYENYPRISEGTKTYWAEHSDYVPIKNEIVIYTDYYGTSPAIKIGDGEVPVIDLPFVDEYVAEELESHISDGSIHISSADRLKWDNKITCDLDGETIIFSK